MYTVIYGTYRPSKGGKIPHRLLHVLVDFVLVFITQLKSFKENCQW